MMFGFGWLMMLLVVGLPILLVILLVAVAAGLFQNRVRTTSTPMDQAPFYAPVVKSSPAVPAPTRYCSHCGAGLQSGWTHCPQCGAPIE